MKVDWTKDPLELPGRAGQPREHRGEARQHPHQDRQDAARRDRPRRADGARDARPDAQGREHARQSRRHAVGARGHEDARGSAPRDRRRQPGRQERGRDALQQGFAGAAGPARHAAGNHAGGAEHPRSRRLSRTSPRHAASGASPRRNPDAPHRLPRRAVRRRGSRRGVRVVAAVALLHAELAPPHPAPRRRRSPSSSGPWRFPPSSTCRKSS